MTKLTPDGLIALIVLCLECYVLVSIGGVEFAAMVAIITVVTIGGFFLLITLMGRTYEAYCRLFYNIKRRLSND